jgi:tetratricopeptide (TPR) repeat protein
MTKQVLGRGLPDQLKEKEMMSEFKRILEAWRAEGYNVSRLEGVLELDLDSISQAFTLFDNDVKNLKDISEIVNMMDTTGFESEVTIIKGKLKDPDQTAEVLQEVYKLDNIIRSEREKAAQEKRAVKVDKWSKGQEQTKTDLIDLWEKSEQEAVVPDPSKLKDEPLDVPKQQEDDLENRLSSIRNRLQKLSLDKSIPLRSDKPGIMDNSVEEKEPASAPEANSTQETKVEEPTADTPEPPAAPETPAQPPEPPEEPAQPTEPPEEPAQPTEPPQEPAPTSVETPSEPPVEEKGTELPVGNQSDLTEALELAKDMYRKKEYEKSIEYFDMVLEQDPSNSDAIFFKKRAEAKLK